MILFTSFRLRPTHHLGTGGETVADDGGCPQFSRSTQPITQERWPRGRSLRRRAGRQTRRAERKRADEDSSGLDRSKSGATPIERIFRTIVGRSMNLEERRILLGDGSYQRAER